VHGANKCLPPLYFCAPKPHSDKTSCALSAPPSMKMAPASYCAANCLLSVDIKVICIAEDLLGLGNEVAVAGSLDSIVEAVNQYNRSI